MALTATTTRLLERERELEALDQLLRSLGARGHVAVVRGPAGIGKTSLLRALTDRRASGAPMLTATGGELEQGHAFGLVRQLFNRSVIGADARRRDALLSGAAAFAAPALGLPGPAADPAGILHGLYWLLAGLAADAPHVIVIDDAHWADETSLQFVHYVARRIDDLPVLLLLAHRLDEAGAARELLVRLADLPSTVAVEPSPLSNGAVETVVRSVLEGDPSREFCDECARVTAGNPFLLHELLRAARLDGLTGAADEATIIRQMTPATISRAVTARLARTSEPSRRLAQAVAILGADAHPALAAKLAELTAEQASEATDELTAAGLLRHGPGLDFVHPLVRASVGDGMRPGARSVAHRRAAELRAGAGHSAGNIAAHLHLTDPVGDPWVVSVMQRAASEARAEGAPLRAAEHLERALDEPARSEERYALLLELGDLLHAVDAPRAIAHLTAALQAVGDDDEVLNVRWALSRARANVGDFNGAADELERTAEITTDLDRRRTHIAETLLWRRLGGFDREGTLELLRSVMPDDGDNREGARDVRTALAVEALEARCDHTAIADVAERGVIGSPNRLSVLSTMAFYLLVWVDRADVAHRVVTASIERERALGRLLHVTNGYTNRALAALRLGMLREAETDARAAWQLARERRPGAHRSLALLAWALLEQGALDEAEAEWAACTARDPDWRSRPDVFSVAQISFVRARLSLAQGDPAAAADWVLAAAAAMRERGLGHLAISHWHDVAVRSLIALGRTDEAAAIAADALRDGQSLGTPTAQTISLRLSALATSNRARQIELLEQAASHLDGVASPVEQARTLLELGAALRRNKRRVDSRDPLRGALDLAVRVNAVPLAERAREELRAAGARPRRVMLSGPESLTASELRVAQLAATGLTNPEIAQRLYVTRSTVETHLSRSFMKLSITSRAQLAEVLDADRTNIGEPHR